MVTPLRWSAPQCRVGLLRRLREPAGASSLAAQARAGTRRPTVPPAERLARARNPVRRDAADLAGARSPQCRAATDPAGARSPVHRGVDGPARSRRSGSAPAHEGAGAHQRRVRRPQRIAASRNPTSVPSVSIIWQSKDRSFARNGGSAAERYLEQDPGKRLRKGAKRNANHQDRTGHWRFSGNTRVTTDE